jgi:hypothetical protein
MTKTTKIDTSIQDALDADSWTSAAELYLALMDTVPVARAIQSYMERVGNVAATPSEMIKRGRRAYISVCIARQVWYKNVERRGRGENAQYRLA